MNGLGPGQVSQVRVIGGKWRGRRIHFPERPDLRPSPDRVRVTLFNWLAPVLSGARCLDLFAGSGCLGLEAVSRGASRVVLIEHDPATVRVIAENLRTLGAVEAEVVRADALAWLGGPVTPFDVVFVDPPFAGGDVPSVLAKLRQGWLAPRAFVYLETAHGAPDLDPVGWETFRDRRAGQVRYRLLRAST